MAVQKNFVIKNGLEVNGTLVSADALVDKVGIGTDTFDSLSKLTVDGSITAKGNLYLQSGSGIGSIYNAKGTILEYENAYINTGIVTNIIGTAVTYTTGNITNLSGSGDVDYSTGTITTLDGSSAFFGTVDAVSNLYVGGALFDNNDSDGDPDQVLTSTGTGVTWKAIPSSSSSSWSLNGSDLYYSSGNVGIGTSTNLYKLSVNGQIESQASQGTAPFVVRSTTNVPNLNASLLSGKSAPTGDIVGTTATQTLTSKTINLINNTLSGTLSQFNTALSDADFVSTTGTETLTNKTLTSPVISSISNSGIQTVPTGNGILVSSNSLAVINRPMLGDLQLVNTDIASNANIEFSKISTVGVGNSIENDDIANSTIQNAKLVNSTISGVSLGSNLNSLTAGTFLSGDPYNGSVARTWNISATSSNTPDTLVSRDSNGDFSVGTINVENFNSTGNGIIDGNLGIGTTLARHTLDVIGGFSFSGEAIESVKITAGTLLANQNINLTDGMVHYFTSNEVGVSTANVRIDGSTSLNSKMNVGTTVAVTVIITPNTVGYSTCINIDGSYNDVKWLGGTDPTFGSSSGVDIYTYQIIKTASSTFTVLGSVNNFA